MCQASGVLMPLTDQATAWAWAGSASARIASARGSPSPATSSVASPASRETSCAATSKSPDVHSSSERPEGIRGGASGGAGVTDSRPSSGAIVHRASCSASSILRHVLPRTCQRLGSRAARRSRASRIKRESLNPWRPFRPVVPSRRSRILPSRLRSRAISGSTSTTRTASGQSPPEAKRATEWSMAALQQAAAPSDETPR